MKVKNKKYLFIVVALSIMMSACHDDYITDLGTESTSTITTPIDFEEVKGNLVGFVSDVHGNTLSNVSVSYYGGNTITNEFGIFQFQNANMDKLGTIINTSKSGYYNHTDIVFPSNNTATARLVMHPQNQAEPFASTSGINHTTSPLNGSIIISPSSLVLSNGSLYLGTAYLELEPSLYDSENITQINRSGLLGRDIEGRDRVLAAYSSLTAYVIDAEGSPLRIRNGNMVDIKFPISSSLSSVAPQSISIWHLDEASGKWIEQGQAEKEGAFFVAKVQNFGSWLLATDYPLAHVCGSIVSGEKTMEDYKVDIFADDLLTYTSYSDSKGNYCGVVPLGVELDIIISHPLCDSYLSKTTIGPFEKVDQAAPINIDGIESLIMGKIVCEGAEYANGSVVIKNNDKNKLIFPNEEGEFIIPDDIDACIDQFRIFAFDNITNMASNIQALDLDAPTETIRLEVCSEACVEANFTFDIDDACIDGNYDYLTVNVTNGSGEYTLLWSDGSTNPTITNIVANQEYCITITDEANNCEKQICITSDTYKAVSALDFDSYNTNCTLQGGALDIVVEGGFAPYKYQWEGPNGFTSSDANIDGLRPGQYYITITDQRACEFTESYTVYDVTSPIDFVITKACSVSQIAANVSNGQSPFTYSWDGGDQVGELLIISQPGNYCVTVSDANNCKRTGCVEVSEVGLLPDFDYNQTCDFDELRFSDLNGGVQYYYKKGSNKFELVLNGNTATTSILETGYEFVFGMEEISSNTCYLEETILLPHFEGLSIDMISDPSCESCQDGSISYTIDSNATCSDCLLGESLIISKENFTDVTNLNNQGALTVGTYVVVVLDNNNGCMIAHKEVILE